MSRKKKTTRGNPAARVTLYHYTHKQHLSRIKDSGEIRVTESNVSFERSHAGPDVVWLTSNPNLLGATSDGLRYGNGESKAQVRFTVTVPRGEAHTWEPWARLHGASERAIKILARAGGAKEWVVVERPISSEDWLAIDITDGDDGD